MAKSATPLGNADIDVAPAIDKQLLHAPSPWRFARPNHALIVGRAQYLGTLEIIDRQIFRAAFECLETPGRKEPRDRHAFGNVLLLVPAVEFTFVRRVDVGHKQEQSWLCHHETSQVWGMDGATAKGERHELAQLRGRWKRPTRGTA